MAYKFKIRLFITGIYRSGTTLVDRILNNHSKIWVTYDSVHFMRFSYGRYNPIHRFKNAEKLVKEIHSRLFRRWRMKFDLSKVLGEIKQLDIIAYKNIYDIVMNGLVSEYKKGAIGWGEKTNVCWSGIPNFLNMFPDGKVIHLLRDPRDVMCSFKKMTYEPGYLYLDSAFCSLDSFLKSREYKRRFSNKNYYVLKYEDFLEDPQEETKNICRFLGLNFELSMLNVKKFMDKKGKWWNGDSSFEKKMVKICKKPIERWKKSTSPLEIFFAEHINKKSMQRYGYELSGISLKRRDMEKLHAILESDKLLSQHYKYWLRTGKGVEAYPTDPTKK